MTRPVLALVGDGVQRRAQELAEILDPRWDVVPYHPAEDVRARVQEAVAAVGMPGAVRWCDVMPRLRLLQVPGAGIDGLDLATIPPGCEVCNVYEHEASVAEYVFSALAAFERRRWLEPAAAALKEGEWRFFDRIGGEARPSLCGKTLGIIGFGHIGQRCAGIALAFNMRVVVSTRQAPRRRASGPFAQARFVETVDDVAAAADYLLVACPLTAETRGLINARVLARMPRHAVLINPARSEIVDEQALFEALSARAIGGAIIDVWWRYPRGPHERITGSAFPFHTLDNVLLTPHLAANTDDTVRRRWAFVGENLNRFLLDRPRLNRVALPARAAARVVSPAVRIVGIIPARMASGRFPGKPLRPIHDLPMVEHVRRRALLCPALSDVIVATCDEEIARTVRQAGGSVLMTSAEHPTGTDRVAEALQQLDCTHVFVIQGDEPLILPEDLARMADAVAREPGAGAWNAVGPVEDERELADRSVVKGIVSASGRLMFCSRNLAAIPGPLERKPFIRKVLGLLVFERRVLERFPQLARTPYEQAESIEQSRLLESDIPITAVNVRSYPGVNEPRDVAVVEAVFAQDPVQRAVLEQILTP